MSKDKALLYKVNGQHHTLTWNDYHTKYNDSITNPDNFWHQVAQKITWFENYTKVKNADFALDNFHINWFENGKLNACYECIDKHLPAKANDIALICEHNDPNQEADKYTYQELSDNVNKLTNGLKSIGVTKGDIVLIYMPMIAQTIFSILACARIGAVHCVVFTGFSAHALADRIEDSTAKYLITADLLYRGTKTINLKDTVDEALQLVKHTVGKVIVHPTNNQTVAAHMQECRDISMVDILTNMSTQASYAIMDSEDPLFILYTSGSTAKPKGIVHTTAGYLVYTHHTFEMVLDYKDQDIYWCTADVGWITGHSYVVYGPLLNGATILIYDGVINYPTNHRLWEVCEKHQVNILYTAPTLIRTLMLYEKEHPITADLSNLRILGSVGEPLNLSAWEWLFHNIGNEKLPIVDTWWQTETGGHMIAPIPYIDDMRPTKASLPFFGVSPVILDVNGQEVEANQEGYLCFKEPWPAVARDIHNNHERYLDVYFKTFPGYYLTGDGAVKDEDGYIKITGRIDDIMNISGHRFGSAELENIANNTHKDIIETAVIGVKHPIKGDAIYVFYITSNPALKLEIEKAILDHFIEHIGKIAIPEQIVMVPDLPKTRSGKIMRRLLKKIANNQNSELGDMSTLANIEVVEHIIQIMQDLKHNS